MRGSFAVLILLITNLMVSCIATTIPAAGLAPAQTNSPVVREVAPGVFEIGKVRLNKRQSTVTFPVAVNMRTGVVEYLLVTNNGKTHESIFKTDTEPYQVQLAMLLLGAKGRGTNAFPQDTKLPPPGDLLRIELVCTNAGKSVRIRVEDFVFDKDARKRMKHLNWIYNGSFIDSDGFAAQQTGSIISLIDDPEALINNPLPKRDDDENWLIEESAVRQMRGPAEITLSFQPKPAQSHH